MAGNQSQETRTIKVDAAHPTIAETVTGTSGSGGWFTSSAIADAVTSDAISGVIGEEMHVENDEWTPIGTVDLSDGSHTVEYRAEDEAGNIASHTVTVNIDTIAPTANVTAKGTVGANGWYTSDITIDLESSDAISGVAKVKYQDGAFWYPDIGRLPVGRAISAFGLQIPPEIPPIPLQ